MTFATSPGPKNSRGHVRTVHWNKHAKFEVRSCDRFEAIYGSQLNDAIIIVTSRIIGYYTVYTQNDRQNDMMERKHYVCQVH